MGDYHKNALDCEERERSAVLSIVLWIFGSSASIVGRSLSLEQETEFRGTMMSAHSAAVGVGSTLGAMIGGLILLRYEYSELGYIIGAFGIISVIIYHLFSEEPTGKKNSFAGASV